MLQALVKGNDGNYVEVIGEVNKDCSTDIMLYTNPVRIPMGKGVKHGNILLPNLCTACLEMVFGKFNWESGVTVNGERINHLRFVDDVVFVVNSASEVNKMLQELNA